MKQLIVFKILLFLSINANAIVSDLNKNIESEELLADVCSRFSTDDECFDKLERLQMYADQLSEGDIIQLAKKETAAETKTVSVYMVASGSVILETKEFKSLFVCQNSAEFKSWNRKLDTNSRRKLKCIQVTKTDQ